MKWFVSVDSDNRISSLCKSEWDGNTLQSAHYWDRKSMQWIPTAEVFYAVYVGDNGLEEVPFSAIESVIPAEAKVGLDSGKSASVEKKNLTKGVPSITEVEQAKSKLEILPNPNHPDVDNPDKYVESPWQIVPVPTVDPNVWDNAQIELVKFDELYATDPFLKRKNVLKHIDNMGQAVQPYRSYALVVVKGGRKIIIDGHHRLMAQWLLGQDTAPVWKVDL